MTLLIIILIIAALYLLGPYIRQWIVRYAQRKFEDRMRAMMGMPSRAEQEKAEKAERRKAREEQKDSRRQSSWFDRFGSKKRHHPVDPTGEAIRMMRLYAEDADYVEIREYSQSVVFAQDATGEVKFVVEEQMSEAEYQLIR
ncbi:MAG: hypothetical protein K2M59_09170 [Muribaculaceae bacterium]|nr:hypothetical protein [Muribaculaceae bacterium]